MFWKKEQVDADKSTKRKWLIISLIFQLLVDNLSADLKKKFSYSTKQTNHKMELGYLVPKIQEQNPLICKKIMTRQYRGQFGWIQLESNWYSGQ